MTAQDSRDDWAARVASLGKATPERKPPVTADRIVDTALALIAREGFDAVTMRGVASALQTGPATLYAHVRNKAQLDDLVIGRLCASVDIPVADPARWRGQFTAICEQLRDRFLAYPGVSRAALAAPPGNLDTLRVAEAMLSILLAGGIPPQRAAWASDATFLYVCAYSLEMSMRWRPDAGVDGRVLDREEVVERFRMLPPSQFPNTVAYAAELNSGEGHDRFDFTLDLLLEGLTR